MSLGGIEILVVGLVFFLPFLVILWGIIDAATRPDWAWVSAGQNKTLWVALQAIGVFFCLVGLVLSIVYLTSIRPKVAAAQEGGGRAGPGAPPPPPPSVPPGWLPDPSGRHQLRYWDGSAWTANVSDGGNQSTEPTP